METEPDTFFGEPENPRQAALALAKQHFDREMAPLLGNG